MPGEAVKTHVEADRSKIDAPTKDWKLRLLPEVADRQNAAAKQTVWEWAMIWVGARG